MAEEIVNIAEETENDAGLDLVSELQKIKENTVPREKYDRIVQERDRYAQALLNGEDLEESAPAPDVGELRQKLFCNGENLSNMEYIKAACDLRDAIIKEGGEDPFVPIGRSYTPTDEDYASAEKVANIYRECLEAANGDPDKFNTELMRRVPSDSPVGNARVRR